MDDLIKKLIEVDKTARKSVENAAASRVAAVKELDEKKQKLREENDREFLLQSEKMKKDSLAELESAEKAIAEKENAAAEELSAVYKENCERWVSEAVQNIIGG
ncbi:MAG: hypothetical protein Q4D20_04195 [Clostridia bacterium]|nr:hypothetical protein [Clostridia bacterium]